MNSTHRPTGLIAGATALVVLGALIAFKTLRRIEAAAAHVRLVEGRRLMDAMREEMRAFMEIQQTPARSARVRAARTARARTS